MTWIVLYIYQFSVTPAMEQVGCANDHGTQLAKKKTRLNLNVREEKAALCKVSYWRYM